MKELVQIAQGAGFKLLLLGYTDTLGSAKNNEKLGLNRAKVVADALVALGVPADRIVTTSRSEEALVTNDSSPANANRRVEFRLAFQD
jgi:OOP family OmpA-OmpF porin